MATNIKGTSNIIAKLSDNHPTLLFVDKTAQIAPYRVSNLETLSYDPNDHAYDVTFGGTTFHVLLSEYDIYLLTE